MTDAEKQKIARFLNDTVMAEAVRDVLTKTFLKPLPNKDVHHLAAARIAVDFLEDGWKELEKYKAQAEQEPKQERNIGV